MQLLLLALAILAVNASPAVKWYEVQPALDVNIDGGIFDTRLSARWEEFKDKYSKDYGEEEEKSRFNKFSKNVAMIDKHNAEEALGIHTYTMGVNQYADMDNLELQQMLNGFRRPTNYTQTGSTYLDSTLFGEEDDVDCIDECDDGLPRTVDWRTKGYVTAVKNQGGCGSCYAFSTTGSLEGQTFKKTGKLISLSEQNIVDCSRRYYNDGCEGGLMTNSFNYIKDNKGIDVEKAYPYNAWDGTCRFNRKNVGATVTGYVELPEGIEKKLKRAIATVGPISAAIDSSHNSFMFYESGVYIEPKCSSTELDHAVLIVGYGRKKKQSYWIVKNSWGPEWGEEGYVRMARNLENQCGIASYCSYPLV